MMHSTSVLLKSELIFLFVALAAWRATFLQRLLSSNLLGFVEVLTKGLHLYVREGP